MRSVAIERAGESPRRIVGAALGAAVCLAALPLAGCGGDGEEGPRAAAPATPAARSAVTVEVASFKFRRDPVRLRAGGTVTFVNRDKAPHTAQTDLNSETAEFDTGRLERGDRKAVELTDPGRFEYFCAYHRFMEGTVEVVE